MKPSRQSISKYCWSRAKYTYDAIYRLIQATGREHLGQAMVRQFRIRTMMHTYQYTQHGFSGILVLMKSTRWDATAKYVYDAVGNILK
jgi:hypothetical protein